MSHNLSGDYIGFFGKTTNIYILEMSVVKHFCHSKLPSIYNTTFLGCCMQYYTNRKDPNFVTLPKVTKAKEGVTI